MSAAACRLGLLLASLLLTTAAYAQVSSLPAGQFMASPSATVGFLAPRSITSIDLTQPLTTPPPIGAVTPNTGNFTAGTFTSLGANSNPSVLSSLVANATPVYTTLISNGATSISGTSIAQAVFGLTSSTGTGQTLANSNNLSLYSGMKCQAGSRQCWAFNALTELDGTLSGDFVSANAEEIDFNNASGTNFNNTYGALAAANVRYVGNTLITGTGANNAAYAIAIGGLNTSTGQGMYNRGIEFINTLGATLADIQSDDLSQSTLADFGTHQRAFDLKGFYSGTIINILPANALTPVGITTGGTYTSTLFADTSTVPNGISLNGTYSNAALLIASGQKICLNVASNCFLWNSGSSVIDFQANALKTTGAITAASVTTTAINSMTIGSQASGATATPTNIAFDDSFSNSAGSNPKIKLFSTGYGIGLSSGQQEYLAASGGQHVFFINAANVGSISSTAWTNPNKTTTQTFQLDTGTKTATATAGAATLNKASGKITSEALTTAAGSTYTLTLTNSQIAATDQVFASADNGTNTQGELSVQRITPASGSVVILVKNTGAAAYNGTIVISFMSLKN